MSTTTAARSRTQVLGHYTTPAGARILYARRKQGVTYVTDEPASPKTPGVLYAVDQIPVAEGDGALHALAADYMEQARLTGSIPMTRTLFSVELQAAA